MNIAQELRHCGPQADYIVGERQIHACIEKMQMYSKPTPPTHSPHEHRWFSRQRWYVPHASFLESFLYVQYQYNFGVEKFYIN